MKNDFSGKYEIVGARYKTSTIVQIQLLCALSVQIFKTHYSNSKIASQNQFCSSIDDNGLTCTKMISDLPGHSSLCNFITQPETQDLVWCVWNFWNTFQNMGQKATRHMLAHKSISCQVYTMYIHIYLYIEIIINYINIYIHRFIYTMNTFLYVSPFGNSNCLLLRFIPISLSLRWCKDCKSLFVPVSLHSHVFDISAACKLQTA